MFQYFDKMMIDNKELIDIYKQYDIKTFIESDDYIYHKITTQENLMTISYKYYSTIDDWWILYIFNDLDDIIFSLLTEETLTEVVTDIINKINTFPSIIYKDKLKIYNLLIDYYNDTYDKKESIKRAAIMTERFLNSDIDNNVISDMTEFLTVKLTEDSFIYKQLKIPSINLVYQIKNKFEEYELEWKSK